MGFWTCVLYLCAFMEAMSEIKEKNTYLAKLKSNLSKPEGKCWAFSQESKWRVRDCDTFLES